MTRATRTATDARSRPQSHGDGGTGGRSSQTALAGAPLAFRACPGAHRWRIDLRGKGTKAPGTARTVVRAHLEAHGIDPEDAVLVVSELVTNAELHGGGATWLSLAIDHTRIRIAVGDRLPGALPQVGPLDADAESGRGTLISAALAETLRIEQCGRRSKRVEATLARRPAGPGP